MKEQAMIIPGRTKIAFIAVLAALSFALGMLYSMNAGAAEKAPKKETRVVYPKKAEVDFEGMAIQGEVRSPGEFYFQRRPEEKFDSLVKRRKNFHKEMLRDVVMSR